MRTVLADLFRKMGHNGVRITHGPGEKGKDIVFYSDGPMGERRLFACVVKVRPINGRADDHKSGAPTLVAELQTVVNQVQSAFSEPIADGKGRDEWIDSVYVISPYECATSTIDSVKSVLQRSGQIRFVCGSDLIQLFVQYWREFLWFESSILVSYLSTLRKGLEEDYALASLILRNPYLGRSPSSWTDLYVEPQFYRKLRTRRLLEGHTLTLDVLYGAKQLADVKSFRLMVKRVSALLEASVFWSANATAADHAIRLLLELGDEIDKLWTVRYREYFAKPRKSAGGRQQEEESFILSEQDVVVTLRPSQQLLAHARSAQESVAAALTGLGDQLSVAARFASVKHRDPLAVLDNPEFLTYCQVGEAARVVPLAFDQAEDYQTLLFEEGLLDHYEGSLLVTGPAGFGKTTFCKWHAIHDANRLVQKEATVLPVYRALHPLSQGTIGKFDEVFFPEEELKSLLQQQSAGKSPFSRIRLYLDGLDEVTSAERQEKIVKLAEEAATNWAFLQVIMTARDHVSSPNLRWLPRIRLSELSDEKINALAKRWLGADETPLFFARLTDSGNIADLMRVPLLATLILMVFRKTKSVPPNKTKLYTLFVELLCGGWDFYKNVQRRASEYTVRDKEVVLARLAGMLQHAHKRDATESDFKAAIKNSMNTLLPQWKRFMQDIIEDGLLLRVGRTLTFSHLSFQEFLASRDLRDHMGRRPKQALGWYINGDDWWKETLAFYVSLLDRPGEVDEWLLQRAMASTSAAPDLEARVQYLRRAIKVAFPSYTETTACESLYREVSRKARKFGGINV
ncbi:MAG TPA: hypothetical protein VGD64_00160 [Acidisarcina sp.]